MGRLVNMNGCVRALRLQTRGPFTFAFTMTVSSRAGRADAMAEPPVGRTPLSSAPARRCPARPARQGTGNPSGHQPAPDHFSAWRRRPAEPAPPPIGQRVYQVQAAAVLGKDVCGVDQHGDRW